MCIFLNREKVSIYLWCSALTWKVQIMAFFAIAHSQSTQIAAIQTDCSLATFCLQIGAKGLEICGEARAPKWKFTDERHNGSIARRIALQLTGGRRYLMGRRSWGPRWPRLIQRTARKWKARAEKSGAPWENAANICTASFCVRGEQTEESSE